MNFRYLYIALVLGFAYMLLFSWGQESEIKKEVAQRSANKIVDKDLKVPVGCDGLVDIQNEKMVVRISTISGKICEVRLREYPVLKNNPLIGVRLFGFENEFMFYLNSGFAAKDFSYRVVKTFKDSVELISIDGLVSKKISFQSNDSQLDNKNDYEFFIEDRFVGEAKGDNLTPYVAMYRTDDKALDARGGFFENSSYTGVAFNTSDDPYANFRLRSVDEKKAYLEKGGWLAFIQKYFMAAILTPSDRIQTFSVAPPGKDTSVYGMAAMSPEGKDFDLAAGIEHRIFVGPKVRSDLLARAGDLELTIDMGWFWFLAQPLMMMLSVINGFIGNWGISIILLTLIIKLFFWPISAKGFSSMAKMRAAQPKMKELQDRYKDDKTKLGQEMMSMYKTEGINPVGGCFPMLLQMPIFISFFFCLRESVELRHESFFFWIQDLSAPDPLFILPVVFAGLMYLTQQLNPQPAGMDPTQAQVMKFMPIMIAGIFVIMPSGLVLYSIANSGISLVQQRAMYKKYETPSSGGDGG